MGLRFRRSVNLGGGLRLNLSKSGVGISGGVRGARTGIGPRGTRTAIGIPGTGIYYEKRGSLKSGSQQRKKEERSQEVTPSTRKIKAGFIASLLISKEEKEFIKGINFIIDNKKKEALTTLETVVHLNQDFIDAYYSLALLESDSKKQLNYLKKVLKNRESFGSYYNKYKAVIGGFLQITEEIGVYIANDEMGLELLSAEVMEENGEITEAIDLLANSAFLQEPVIRLSLGELYYQAGQYNKCIETLQDVENNDALGTTSLYYAALAFRDKGLSSAAVDTFRKALRRRKDRSPELLMEVRYALAETLEANGERAKARKEFEKVAAQDVNFRDALERANALRTR